MYYMYREVTRRYYDEIDVFSFSFISLWYPCIVILYTHRHIHSFNRDLKEFNKTSKYFDFKSSFSLLICIMYLQT